MKQKLQRKLKNTPTDTSLVCSSVSSGLNKRKNAKHSCVSDQSTVLLCNNSEENHRQHSADSDCTRVLNIVYVLDKKGKALMPSCQSKARRLLKSNKAKVVKRYPFTIQLIGDCGHNKQEVILGVDTGHGYIGISALSKKQELLSAEIVLRNNIVELLSEKRMYRRGRRNKHHWYREPRFDNREKSSGWLAPSIQHKVDSHIRIINKIGKLLPISKIILETAKFDIQKINNIEISGKEYQEGVQSDFWNVREYVLYRDNHTCQHCKKTKLVLNVHHIVTRQTGGNRPDNLVTLCTKCHDKFHKGKIKLNIKIKNNFKPQTTMSIIRKYIISELSKNFIVEETFGYITKSKRIENKIEKSHINDAFVIANGNKQIRIKGYSVEQKRKNNRCLQTNRKGFAPSIRRNRYKIQPSDIVRIKGINYNAKGIFNKGDYVRVVDNNDKVYNFKCSLVEGYFNRGTWIWK